jgi:hypothetical protein
MEEFKQRRSRRRSVKKSFKQKKSKKAKSKKRTLPPYLKAWNQQVRSIWLKNKATGMTYGQAMVEAKRQRDGY